MEEIKRTNTIKYKDIGKNTHRDLHSNHEINQIKSKILNVTFLKLIKSNQIYIYFLNESNHEMNV